MLSKFERLSLLNQFQILEQTGNGAPYTREKEILQNGYGAEYASLFQHLDDDMADDVAPFVQDVLMMYDALQVGRGGAGPDAPMPRAIEFLGFDGNNESAHLSYCRFLLTVDGRWTYIKGPGAYGGNSHMPTLEMYGRMLERWKALGSPSRMSDAQVEDVAGERIHPENR